MSNNSLLRRLLYIFSFTDAQMIDIFNLEGVTVSKSLLSQWLKKETDPKFLPMTDQYLAVFLNGFITLKRGRKDGMVAPVEKELTNNLKLRKLKIALSLIDQDIIDLIASTGLHISKHEVSSFFRGPEQRQYVELNDQILRNFMQGLEKRESAKAKK
jgi:uncharacterized protein YehS (DUF1456 family)